MKRVLVVTVGGSSAPVVNAIRQNGPDFVYFLCSSGPEPAAASAGWVEDIVREAGAAEGTWMVETVADADRLDLVLQACERIAVDLAARFGSDAVATANYTGGTKTMSAALAVWALRAPGDWQVQVQRGRRGDLVRVADGDLAYLQQTDELRADELLRQVDGLDARGEHGAAVQVLETQAGRLRLGPDRRARAEAVLRRQRLQAARDRFDFDEALRICGTDGALAEEFRAVLRGLVGERDCFEGERPWPPRGPLDGTLLVRELVRHAGRCASRGRFDDAFGRLYRATELLAQMRLRRVFGIDTGNVDLALPAVGEASRARLGGERNARTGRVEIGLFSAYRLLHELGDPLGARFDRTRDRVQRFLQVRNGSLFAHGLVPIGERDWNVTGSEWTRWLEEACGE